MSETNTGATRRDLLKGVAAGAAVCLASTPGEAEAAAGPKALRRAGPAALGVAPEAVSAFIDEVNTRVGGLHSFMLLRRGQVAAEAWWAPYAAHSPHMLYSLSKSFTSTAVGFAVSEGLLTVDDPVVGFFPADRPAAVSPNLAAMKVRHLLSMSTGHVQDATGGTTQEPSGDWAKGFLGLPVEKEPGSLFVYNSAATYMLSAIVQKLTGKGLVDYLMPRLFAPLGIARPTWETCPKGIATGGWGLNVTTEDIARFGHCYLQKGAWEGKQVIPAAWVAEATRKQVSSGSDPNSDWAQGYGYQFWRCRHAAYRGDGAFGQYCIVMPEQEAVLAITSGVGNMQAVLDCVWEKLLPGIGSAPTASDGQAALERKIAALAVPSPSAGPAPGPSEGVIGRTYRLDTNPLSAATARLTRGALTLTGQGKPTKLSFGFTRWVAGRAPLMGRPGVRCAGRAAWTAPDTLTIKLCFTETPYEETIACTFAGQSITVTSRLNVSFGPSEGATLRGVAE
jgi:CubicO group peptidase (beta-lactamase class C family)